MIITIVGLATSITTVILGNGACASRDPLCVSHLVSRSRANALRSVFHKFRVDDCLGGFIGHLRCRVNYGRRSMGGGSRGIIDNARGEGGLEEQRDMRNDEGTAFANGCQANDEQGGEALLFLLNLLRMLRIVGHINILTFVSRY